MLTNLLALPGLGSFLGGRRVAGCLQILLSLAGFVLTLDWFVNFLSLWWQTGEFPFDGGPHFLFGLAGVGVFGFAWLWGLASGLKILKEARTQPRHQGIDRPGQ